MKIKSSHFKTAFLSFCLLGLFLTNCSNITDQRSACEYRVNRLLQTCTLASLVWPNYFFGQESNISNENVRNSLTFCTVDYLKKSECRRQKDYLPTRKDLDK